MNRKFLERLMYFNEQARIRADDLEGKSDIAPSSAFQEARTALAYLSVLLDTYWAECNDEHRL